MAANIRFQLLPDGRAIWQQPLDNSHNNTLTPGLQEGDLTALARQLRGQRSMLVYPGEQVHCLSLQAPSRRRSAWLQALPFALEDQIAQELETSHLAVGKFSAQHRLAVAVVQREALRQAFPGIQEWAGGTDFLSSDNMRHALTIVTDAARRSGITSLDELKSLPLESALDRAGNVLAAAKDAVRLYGIDLDAIADSLQVEVLEIDGSTARVRTTVTVFNAPIATEHDLVLLEGRWYGKEAAENFDVAEASDS